MDKESRENHFWNNYLAVLSERQIKSSLFTWYVRHCESFIGENRHIRLKQHTKITVSSYLAELINSDKKEAWQKRQAIDALGLLFKSIHAPLYSDIDWEYWKLSCRDLGKEHDTNYRSEHPVEFQSNAPSSPLNEEHSLLLDEELDKLRLAIRRMNYSIRTEKTYTDWVQKFLKFNNYKDSFDIDQQAVMSFLEYLAIEREVAPKTQSIALNAISFYFKQILGREIGDISQFVRAKPREKLPVILTRDEVSLMLENFIGVQWLVVSLLYGAGLRIMEAMRLRVQDIDFGFSQILIRDAKGKKERAMPLPTRLIQPFKDHLSEVKSLHNDDIDQGFGRVYMSPSLVKKFGKSDQ